MAIIDVDAGESVKGRVQAPLRVASATPGLAPAAGFEAQAVPAPAGLQPQAVPSIAPAEPFPVAALEGMGVPPVGRPVGIPPSRRDAQRRQAARARQAIVARWLRQLGAPRP